MKGWRTPICFLFLSITFGAYGEKVREHYGQGADAPVPDSIAFYSIVTLIDDLSGYRYDVARLMVEQRMRTDTNETTNLIDSLRAVVHDIEVTLDFERRERFCVSVSTEQERDILYQAMDEFDDWKEEFYQTKYEDFMKTLGQQHHERFLEWMANKSTSVRYEKMDHKSGWEGGTLKLTEWISQLCKPKGEPL